VTVWIPSWLVTVGEVVGVVLAWELVRFLARQWMGLGDKMGWTSW
jgi:hypothetical protein